MARNLQELLQETEEYTARCVDVYSDPHTFNFQVDDKTGMVFKDRDSGGLMYCNMNDHAYGQMINKGMGKYAPTQWMRETCPEDIHADLLKKCVAEFRDADKPMLMRTRDDGVLRAALSDQYGIWNNDDFIRSVIEVMGESSLTNIEVKRAQVDDKLRAYITIPRTTVDFDPTMYNNPDREGGGLNPAAFIYNDEIGSGGIRIAKAVWRLICTNGMMGWDREDIYYRTHKFRNTDVVKLEIYDALIDAFQKSEQFIKQFTATIDVEVPTDGLERLTKSWSKKYGITVEAGENWLAAIYNESAAYGRAEDVRAWDVVNAATQIAQSRSDDEGQLMEAMAGGLVDMYVPVAPAQQTMEV
jgi:hypothetical protein